MHKRHPSLMSEVPSTKKRFDPERRQAAILDAAEALFAKNGYAGTSTTEIAKNADVAVGTIFKHFGDKPTLLAALHRRLEAVFIEAMTSAWHSQSDYRAKFEKMFRALFKVAEQNRDVMPVYTMTKELSANPDYWSGQTIVSQIQALYEAGVKEGKLADLQVDVVAHMMHGMVDGAMRFWMNNPTPKQKNRAIRALVEISERAFL